MGEVTLESQLIEIIKDEEMAENIKLAKIDMLVRLGVDVNAMYGAKSALKLTNELNEREIAKMLKDNKARDFIDEKKANEVGKKLIKACQGKEKKDVKEIKELIDKGADVNQIDISGISALGYASSWGHKEIAELLIQNGADVNQKSVNGINALGYASNWGHKEIVKLLISRGADVNAKNELGNTALIRASKRGYEEIVELLIQNGADVDIENNKGETALMLAFDSKTEKIIKRAVSKKVLLDKIKKGFGIGK
ncbi:MAG: hypothetical protein E7005_06115 [Alphaproteobacteria bacterium]|nr:hypothetical protein [Alphaproteobacteria bacterium]